MALDHTRTHAQPGPIHPVLHRRMPSDPASCVQHEGLIRKMQVNKGQKQAGSWADSIPLASTNQEHQQQIVLFSKEAKETNTINCHGNANFSCLGAVVDAAPGGEQHTHCPLLGIAGFTQGITESPDLL